MTTTTKTKTRTKTKKTRLFRTVSLIISLIMASALTWAQKKPGAKKDEAPHAVVAGTVFRDPGFAQPGATLILTRKDDPKSKKLQEAVSDARGDFAFRVPPGPATYFVTATLKGFKPERQEIPISGEEYSNATIVLVPESK